MGKFDFSFKDGKIVNEKPPSSKKRKNKSFSGRKLVAGAKPQKKKRTKKEYLSPLDQRLISYTTILTNDGLRYLIIKETVDDSKKVFMVQQQNAEFNTVDEMSFDTMEKAKKYLLSIVKEVEVNQGGLAKCMKDILAKLSLMDKDYMFLYELLMDPAKREEYDIEGFEEDTGKEIVKEKKKTTEKHQATNSKLKIPDRLKDKIRGAGGM